MRKTTVEQGEYYVSYDNGNGWFPIPFSKVENRVHLYCNQYNSRNTNSVTVTEILNSLHSGTPMATNSAIYKFVTKENTLIEGN